MTKKTLASVEDVCRIIETCARSGVSSLAFGAVQVSFHPKNPSGDVPVDSRQTSQIENPEEAKLEALAKQAEEDQQELDELHITNPAEYEARLANGELLSNLEDGDERDEEPRSI